MNVAFTPMIEQRFDWLQQRFHEANVADFGTMALVCVVILWYFSKFYTE